VDTFVRGTRAGSLRVIDDRGLAVQVPISIAGPFTGASRGGAP
jgi:hypothetical protein